MLFPFYCHTSMSFVYLCIRSLFSHFFVYLFLPPLFTLLKITDWQSKARVFKLLTRERLFNSLNLFDVTIANIYLIIYFYEKRFGNT